MRELALAALVVTALALTAAPLAANDGFFWGAGETLRPVQSQSLRVRTEKLKITALEDASCYDVAFSTAALARKEGEAAGPEEFGTLGRKVPCLPAREQFKPEWSAEAVYEIEALEDAPGVLFGFPVHTWSMDLDDVPIPGAVAFRTFVGKTELGPTKLKWLEGIGAKKDKKVLGYTWTASFKKGERYTLRTTYDFGIDTSNSFYSDREYAKGETPWFKLKTDQMLGADRMIYYLTPLQQWASPPMDSVTAVVTMPKRVPMEFAVPVRSKPVCVGERSLFFELRGRFPEAELEVSYPMEIPALKLETAADWEAWMRSLGGPQVEMNCALLERLKKEAGPALKGLLAARKCRQSCAAEPR
jgi:hypothetical protein